MIDVELTFVQVHHPPTPPTQTPSLCTRARCFAGWSLDLSRRLHPPNPPPQPRVLSLPHRTDRRGLPRLFFHPQKQYYKAVLEKNVSFLRNGSKKKSQAPQLLNIGMELRKLCNHPFLVKGAREKLENDAATAEQADPKADPKADGAEPPEITALVKNSAKFALLDKLLPKLRKDGHKVLIFTQMVRRPGPLPLCKCWRALGKTAAK